MGVVSSLARLYIKVPEDIFHFLSLSQHLTIRDSPQGFLLLLVILCAVFNLCHGQRLEATAIQAVLLEGLQLVLAHVVDQAGPDGVAQHIDGRPEAVQQPIDGQDDGDVLGGEAHGVEHHDHRDEASLRDSSGADGGRSGRDGDGDDLPDTELHAAHLRYENGRHRLVQGRPVHIDGGPDGQHEARNPRINAVFLLEQVDGDGQRSRGGGGAERGRESVGHVGDEPERHLPRADGEYDGEDDEAMDEEAGQNCGEVEAELSCHQTHVLHLKDLSPNEEEDADGGQVDDKGGNSHHSLRETSEKVQ